MSDVAMSDAEAGAPSAAASTAADSSAAKSSSDAASAAASAAAASSSATAAPHADRKKRKRDRGGSGPPSPALAASAPPPAALVAARSSLLIGKAGGESIAHALAHANPHAYIEQFQREHGIRVPGIEASLAFLDLFTAKRATTYASLLHQSRSELVGRIERGEVEHSRMLAILESSFAYLRVDGLSAVPVAILMSFARAGSFPPKYLRPLSDEPQRSIEALPLELRRVLMENEPDRHFWSQPQMLTMLAAYANDRARIDDYAQLLPVEHLAASCKKVRKGAAGDIASLAASAASASSSSSATPAQSASSTALQGILDWIGSSPKLYKFFCRRLRDLMMTSETAGHASSVWRALRVDLLMRLHEQQSDAKTDSSSSDYATPYTPNPAAAVASTPALSASQLDPLHTWVWCLDAAVKSGTLSEGLLNKLFGFLTDEREHVPGFIDELHSKHPQQLLLDMQMLTSHPAIIAIVLQSILTSLAQVIEREIEPKDHPHLRDLTRVLNLALCPAAVIATTPLSQTNIQLPNPPLYESLFSEFYPFMAELLIYAQMGEMEPLNPKLIEFVNSSPLARSVFLFYLLSRIQAQDTLQSAAILAILPAVTVNDANVWSAASAGGEQQLMHAFLHSACTLLVGWKPLLQTKPALRKVVFTDTLLPLSRESPFAHLEYLRLLIECEDILAPAEVSKLLRQLKTTGALRAEPSASASAAASTDAAAVMTDEATATQRPSAPVVVAQSTTNQQIAALYAKLKSAKPELFEA